MSDFPRGWTLSSQSGAAITLTAPAIPGVAHVLDAFECVVFNSTAAAVASNITLSSSDGVFANFPIGLVIALATSIGSDSASDLDLSAGPGASLSVTMAAGFANQLLRIQGHDN